MYHHSCDWNFSTSTHNSLSWENKYFSNIFLMTKIIGLFLRNSVLMFALVGLYCHNGHDIKTTFTSGSDIVSLKTSPYCDIWARYSVGQLVSLDTFSRIILLRKKYSCSGHKCLWRYSQKNKWVLLILNHSFRWWWIKIKDMALSR